MARRGTIQEYLVSLGVEVDQRGVQKMQNALLSTKASVLGITGALAAMVLGITKASKSLTDTTDKFEQMARAGKKNVDAIAAQEIALKTMGKTLKEVNKDKVLKQTFEDLKKIGTEMKMPSAGEGRQQIIRFMGELQRFKVAATYAMHHINNEFLNKMAYPLQQLRKTLADIREKMMVNMPKLSVVVGDFLAKFMTLIIAGVKGVADLGTYIGNLPEVIKKALGAFGAMWVVMKASPIFWILTGLATLLLLLDDFQAYKEGRGNVLGSIWGAEPGDLTDSIFGALDTALEGFDEKIEGFLDVGKKIAEEIVKGLTDFDFEGTGEKVGGFVNRLLMKLIDLVTGQDAFNLLGLVSDSLLLLVTGIADMVTGFFSEIDWASVGKDGIGGFINGMFNWLVDTINKGVGEGGALESVATTLKTVVTSIGSMIVGAMEGIEWDDILKKSVSTVPNIFNGMMEALFGKPELRDAIGNVEQQKTDGLLNIGIGVLRNITKQITDEFEKMDWKQAGKDLGATVVKLFTGLADFFKAENDGEGGLLGDIFTAGSAIVKSLLSAIEGAVGEFKAEDLLVAAQNVGELFLDAFKKIKWKDALDSVGNIGSGILDGLLDVLFGLPELRDSHGNIEQQKQDGLLKIGLDFVEGVVKQIKDAFTEFNWVEAGKGLGENVKKIFSGIATFFEDQVGNEGNIIGSLADAGLALVRGLIGALEGAMAGVTPAQLAQSITSIVGSLFKALTNAFTDEDGEVSTIGEDIGTAIGNAIVWAGDVIIEVAQRLADSFGEDGVSKKFISVGFQIAQDILEGITEGLGDVVGKIIFGEQGWAERKQKSKLREASRAGNVVFEDKSGNVVSQKDINEYIEANPDLAQTAFDTQHDWQVEKAEIEAGFGDRYINPLKKWGHSFDIKDGLTGTKVEDWQKAYGIFMTPWSKEKKELDARVRGVEYGKDTQDPEEYKKRLEYLLAYIEAFKQGKEGDELFGAGGKEVEIKTNLDSEGSLEKLQTELDAKNPLEIQAVLDLINPPGGTTPGGSLDAILGNADGGRYDKQRMVTVSETGQAEYIIPMDRPERAKGLILSMLSEMGSGANDILKAFGVGGGGGGLSGIDGRLAMSGAYPSGGNSTVKANSDNTVTANPIINVYGSNDPVLTGNVAYKATEQVLVRHLRGVLGQ